MKVDKNQLVPNVELYGEDSQIGYFGIPLRLEIAARIYAAQFANSNEGFSMSPHMAISAADDLIGAHNETCEEKPE